MRKNRRRSQKMSVVTGYTFRLGVVFMMLFIMVVVNLIAENACTGLSRKIGDQELVLNRLDDDLRRETARWNAMKSDRHLNQALLKHGLKMVCPRPEQIVRMKPDLTPYESQLSIAHARQESSSGSIAASRARKRR